jgi:hypothetical protein
MRITRKCPYDKRWKRSAARLRRIPTKTQAGEYDRFVGLYPVVQAIREAAQPCAPDVSVDLLIGLRVRCDALDGLIDSRMKVTPTPGRRSSYQSRARSMSPTAAAVRRTLKIRATDEL